MRNVIHTILISLVLFSLSACGSIVSKPVSDADRNTTGEFDGNYVMNIKAFKGRQQVGRAYFNCDMRAGNVSFQVKDGVAQFKFSNKLVKANVDDEGKFRFEVPTDRSYSNTRTGEKSAAAQITYIYQGSLDPDTLKGQFVVGKRSENNEGCAAGMRIKAR